MSFRDPIVEEVRKAGDDYARRFDYDLAAICADLRRKEQESGAVVVTLPKIPAKILPKVAGSK